MKKFFEIADKFLGYLANAILVLVIAYLAYIFVVKPYVINNFRNENTSKTAKSQN